MISLKSPVKRGLDGFAICDHDTVEGGLACEKRAMELGLEITVIPGSGGYFFKRAYPCPRSQEEYRAFTESGRNDRKSPETWRHGYHPSPF